MSKDDFADKAKEAADKAQDFAKDAAGKAQDFAKDAADKAKDALKSDQAEQISDSVLDGLASAADKLTGGKHTEKIEEIRKNLDDKIGND